ncbi:DNA-binding GntR family transcriptional regulator [Rhizobium sp. BK529]|uniref:GntR family transcriptional regulator n=1 Tax=unclassified Rhizobium TaxID=2613769 RepID=UPI001049C7CD|nr:MULTISPECIES: GntR family transcriptional regulator [unclassified Rhizobium]MBB3593331.1 DNA-binding GntR family transcriptional regulator [Rhizobium sp. BK529]TCS03129.1 GntR family transcriptional regulator [Rhizobium sp. BK418]
MAKEINGSIRNETGLLRRPPRLGDEVYSAIYAQLMSLKIPPGGRISVDNLVRELGVSQTPIREALSRLEAQGLVVKTHLIGYSAAPQMDRYRLQELYELRLLVEPFAAARAAEMMSEEMIASLEAIDGEMRSIRQEDARLAYGRFAQSDGAFHDMIALGSGNGLIHETLTRLHTHVHLFRLYFHSRATSDANDEHARIILAIKQRDSAASEAAMRDHIERSRKRFMVIFTGE